MTRKSGNLTLDTIEQLRPPTGKASKLHSDSNGLYLQITPADVRSWIFRFTIKGRTRAMGLGALRNVRIDSARKRARELKVLVDQGIDPIETRKTENSSRAQIQAPPATFRECAEAYLKEMANIKGSWGSEKHKAQWRTTLEKYAYPVIGHKAIADVAVNDIIRVLRPIWYEIPETASRLRGRMEKILARATVQNYRRGDNPARWVGHLSEVFPSRSKVKQVKHHSALPYAEMPQFMARIRQDGSLGSQLLQFLILSMTRTGEARGARWQEFGDLDDRLWVIPGSRMKAGKEHRVPLSEEAVRMLKQLKANNDNLATPSEFVFPGQKPMTCLSNAAALEFLKRIDRRDITPHGMRACARMWCANETSFPRELCEQALAHVNPNRVEAAYQRSDLLSKRRELMEAWAQYCLSDAHRSSQSMD